MGARRFTVALLGMLTSLSGAHAPAFAAGVSVSGQQISGPRSPGAAAAWLDAMKAYRAEQLGRGRIPVSGSDRADLSWTKRCFVEAHLMVEDRFFYDPVTRSYTVRRYLDDLARRYGGVDAVLIWPTYPNIGIDDRNTADMLRGMPGGLPALRRVIAEFHDAGVKVLFPIHPWDMGTRDPGGPWSRVLPDLMAEIGADGLNGDTMETVPREYFDRSLGGPRALALEPELGLGSAVDALGYNTMSYGYWALPRTPMVSRNKWISPAHMVHVNDRWATDKTDLLQAAFFNGTGFLAWENVWGIYNPLRARDAAALARIAAIERAFAEVLASPAWEPHTPMLGGQGGFASKFPSADGRAALFIIVNTGDTDRVGDQIRVPRAPSARYLDLWRGERLFPRVEGDAAVLSFPVEARGFSAVFAGDPASMPVDLDALLAKVRVLGAWPPGGEASATSFLRQEMTPIPRTNPAPAAPPGMIRIPGAVFDFRVSGVEIEGEDRVGVDVQYPWEDAPRRHHRRAISIAPFYIDRHNVTNAEYKRFLVATRYWPADDHDFLKGWQNGEFPAGAANQPVTWVSIEDARAYAAWAGKRLPHEWEWQYAAQGLDGRVYPWGDTSNVAAVPAPSHGRVLPAPADASAFPAGKSPFGVMDLVGNVWQWTDEYTDLHTRAAVLRGGSRYRPEGSMWYFPEAYRLDQHGKYLLMAPGRDRSGMIGFRCAMDA